MKILYIHTLNIFTRTHRMNSRRLNSLKRPMDFESWLTNKDLLFLNKKIKNMRCIILINGAWIYIFIFTIMISIRLKNISDAIFMSKEWNSVFYLYCTKSDSNAKKQSVLLYTVQYSIIQVCEYDWLNNSQEFLLIGNLSHS